MPTLIPPIHTLTSRTVTLATQFAKECHRSPAEVIGAAYVVSLETGIDLTDVIEGMLSKPEEPSPQ